MIDNQDRSGYIGASDTDKVMSNWNTKNFGDFWKIKTGESDKHITNVYMTTGTLYEHPIMQAFADQYSIDLVFDKQVILEDLKLRVNLDANTEDTIYECKTSTLYLSKNNCPSKYIDQVRVQMYATNISRAFIVAYMVKKEDYAAAEEGKVLPIDLSRMNVIEVRQDMNWIENEYLPRLRYLAYCLTNNIYPNEDEMRIFKPKKEISVLPNEAQFNAIQLKMADLNAQKKAIEEQQKMLEQAVLEYMEANQIKSYENDFVKVTYVAPTSKTTIDSKLLKEKYPEIAAECSKESITKASLRIKVNE